MKLRIGRAALSNDLMAGLTWALVNIPQAMAHALLAAVNPVFGLYTLMLATPVGALFTGSAFMNVSTTSAMAVAAGDTLISYPSEDRVAVLVTLVFMIGVFQIVLGLLQDRPDRIASLPTSEKRCCVGIVPKSANDNWRQCLQVSSRWLLVA